MAFDQETIFRILGVLGFGLYVLNYALLSWKFTNSESHWFFLINTMAAVCVLASNYVEFNLPSVMIQVFWIGIGTFAILKRRPGNLSLSR